MNEGFDRLKDIGVQKIHENTHISREHIQAFLHESYDGMSKIQVFGFISIFEREYSLNLDELREKILIYFNDQSAKSIGDDKIFVHVKRKKNLVPLYIILLVSIFLFVAYMVLQSQNSELSDIVSFDNSAIENATINMEISEKDLENETVEEDVKIDVNKSQEIIVELNSSKEILEDENLTKVKIIDEIKEVDKNELISFRIMPKSRVWLGYIDLDTHKRYQKTFKETFALDPNKNWLLAFGHGSLRIEINGIIKKFKIKKNVRFLYKNAELTQIDLEKFKELNEGNRW